ncbi:MAG: tyrosine-type recombinase/integrase [Candidatus Aenigmatarchaeota archaeon]
MRKLPRFLSENEIKAMFEKAEKPRDRLLLKCLFYLGLRNSEVQKLRIEDIDLINRHVKIVAGKGKKDRYVPIPIPELVNEIKAYIGERRDGFLFYLSDRHIRRIVKKYAKLAGIRKYEEVHPHTLRHSYATLLQNKGVPLNVIQEMLGHSSIETTTIYVHLGLEKMREWIEKAFRV